MSSTVPFRSPRKPFRWLLSALVLVGATGGALWWFSRTDEPEEVAIAPSGPFGSGIMVPFRTAGGTLQTNGILKTEELRKESGSWRGTTTSGIRLNATYRYEIELREEWKAHVDQERGIVFVVAPELRPQLPVAVDSDSMQEWTEAGWGRFDKWEHLAELRGEITPTLAERASSSGYIDLARGPARETVEEFVRDWALKNVPWSKNVQPVIKVYFADESQIPYPEGLKLNQFLP